MHELPIVKSVLEAALRYAKQQNAQHIHKVVLTVGKMHDLVPEWVDKFYRFAAKGTIAEGGYIEIESLPVICRCKNCKENYILHLHGPEESMGCPVCGSHEADKLSGDEFLIKEIEVS